MIGFQSYPTLINKSRFKTLQYLSDNFSNTGFADHTDTKKFDENFNIFSAFYIGKVRLIDNF